MFTLRRPGDPAIAAFIESQRALPFSHPHEGATRGMGAGSPPPPGFALDHHRIRLGAGAAAYARARAALARWAMFEIGWVAIHPPGASVAPGTAVAVLIRFPGIWSLNACRIAYAIDEEGPLARSGFAYGTLPGHAEAGEERFLAEWNRADDSVWYDLLAISRPRHPLARLGRPFARLLQRRFARASLRAMKLAAG